MKKTCFNCCFYHGCLSEEKPSQYHIHDYCERWNCVITKDMESEVNHFLESFWSDIDWQDDCGVNTDLETGEAVCWMYYPKQEEDEFFTDEWFENNRAKNKALALRTINKLLNTGKCHDLDGEMMDISREDLVYLSELQEKILNEKK